jgi:hypothetical protein
VVPTINLRGLIVAEKSSIKLGGWRSGKVPKADFPLGKVALRLGASFKWCVVTFIALGAECRVLIVYNPEKVRCDASLGVLTGGGMRVLCTYSYHATEPGWHVHATCDFASRLPAGVFRGPWVKRIPGPHSRHRRKLFGLDGQDAALRMALDHYRIEERGSLL